MWHKRSRPPAFSFLNSAVTVILSFTIIGIQGIQTDFEKILYSQYFQGFYRGFESRRIDSLAGARTLENKGFSSVLFLPECIRDWLSRILSRIFWENL